MNYSNRGGQGGRKGGFKGGFGDRRSSGEQTLHEAKCAECGASCQVPFKPNGRKPVFCSLHFKRDDEGNPKHFDRPGFGDKRSSPAFSDRPSNDRPQMDTKKIEARLAAIEEKLDVLIDALTEDIEDDEDEEMKESKA